MGELAEFEKRIANCLTQSASKPHWSSAEADAYMSFVATRRGDFERIASNIVTGIISPRLGVLAKHFANADLPRAEQPGRCYCTLGFCERFPATAQIEFAIEHDLGFNNLGVNFRASMMPMYIKFHEQDQLTMPFGSIDESAIADWIECRMLEFLDEYLQIDRGGDDLEEDVATDPVCGMRVSRSEAKKTADYRGHPYFFCSLECYDRFVARPANFVQVRTL
jgi:YHS domain-containing protein